MLRTATWAAPQTHAPQWLEARSSGLARIYTAPHGGIHSPQSQSQLQSQPPLLADAASAARYSVSRGIGGVADATSSVPCVWCMFEPLRLVKRLHHSHFRLGQHQQQLLQRPRLRLRSKMAATNTGLLAFRLTHHHTPSASEMRHESKHNHAENDHFYRYAIGGIYNRRCAELYFKPKKVNKKQTKSSRPMQKRSSLIILHAENERVGLDPSTLPGEIHSAQTQQGPRTHL